MQRMFKGVENDRFNRGGWPITLNEFCSVLSQVGAQYTVKSKSHGGYTFYLLSTPAVSRDHLNSHIFYFPNIPFFVWVLEKGAVPPMSLL